MTSLPLQISLDIQKVSVCDKYHQLHSLDLWDCCLLYVGNTSGTDQSSGKFDYHCAVVTKSAVIRFNDNPIAFWLKYATYSLNFIHQDLYIRILLMEIVTIFSIWGLLLYTSNDMNCVIQHCPHVYKVYVSPFFVILILKDTNPKSNLDFCYICFSYHDYKECNKNNSFVKGRSKLNNKTFDDVDDDISNCSSLLIGMYYACLMMNCLLPQTYLIYTFSH